MTFNELILFSKILNCKNKYIYGYTCMLTNEYGPTKMPTPANKTRL